MIEFELSPQQRQLKEFLHWFAENQVRPVSLEADRNHDTPLPLLQQAKAMGLSMESVPSGGGAGGAEGGQGERQGNRIGVIAAEELAWGDASFVLNLPGAGLGGPPVRFMGTPEQKERFLSIFDGPELRWGAYALTEPEAGSDVAGIRTTARKEGDHYILNGTKTFITNGAKASWNVVFATVDRNLGRAGHRAFVVEKGTPGFRVGRIMDKMGLRASETAELVFDNCVVPVENLLGGEERYLQREGFKVAMQTFDSSRPTVAAMAVGIARASYERAREIARQNLMLGRPSPRYAAIVEALATMARKIDAARLLVWKAAWMADARVPNTKEASMSKAYAGQIGMEVCSLAIDVAAGAGLLHDEYLEKWFRDIKVYDIFEGTGQIQRLVVSRRIFDDLGVRI